MRILYIFVLSFFFSLGLNSQSMAREMAVDLSKKIVPITTNFTGSSLLLFGSFNNDDNSDIVIVVWGPYQDEMVRRKKRIMGVWANGDQVTFKKVPSFYSIASSRPIKEFISNDVAKRRQIGINNIELLPKNPNLLSKRIKAEVDVFRAGLIDTKQTEGLFETKVGQVFFKGDRLFRSNLYFPANVPIGEYTVKVMMFRNDRIVAENTTLVRVKKIGIEASIYDFAHRNALSYGIIAVVLATVLGWMASLMFRKS